MKLFIIIESEPLVNDQTDQNKKLCCFVGKTLREYRLGAMAAMAVIKSSTLMWYEEIVGS
jgi:hypothetical protein